MSEPPTTSATEAATAIAPQQIVFASPTSMDSGFPPSQPGTNDAAAAITSTSSTVAGGPPPAAPSATTSPISLPTPLHAQSIPPSFSAASSAAVSRGSSIRSNAPPSSASTTRIRKGLLSRAGSEAEDRIHRAASGTQHPLTTDDDDDELMITDSGPMPRRFASQNRGPPGASSTSRQSSHSSLSPTTWGQRSAALGQKPQSSSSSIASGNRSGSGDAREGSASIGGLSLGRAMSVSSVSSVNSTSSLEAVPFREAPLGNVRLGFGGAGPRAAGRYARASPYGPLSTSMQPSTQSPSSAQDQVHADGYAAIVDLNPLESAPLAPGAEASAAYADLSTSAPASDRHKGVPKPASDAWMYRVGPGMRTNKPRIPSEAASPESAELPLDDAPSSSSPAKRSRDVLRQKFAKGAGRLGGKASIVTGLGPAPSDQFAVYNPLDSSEDEVNLVPPMRTPLPRNSSYFSSAPHSANSAAATPLHPSLTPVPADFRTSSVTNAPLFVPKYGEDLLPTRNTPEPFLAPSSSSVPHDDRIGPAASSSQAPSLPPLSYAAGSSSITFDLSPFFAASDAARIGGIGHPRRRSSATQRPQLLSAHSSNDAFDRTASPGLMVDDPSVASAPAAQPSLYTVPSPALSAQRSPQVGPNLTSSPSPHPTPAEVVRMEAQAGIASLPDSPSEPSPVPASYSPALGDETVAPRRLRDSSHPRIRRPSSGTGSEASLPMATAAGPSRRPESLQRQRMWSNAKRPAILRARTSESSISRGRRSQSHDCKASSPAPQSPIEDPILEGAYDRPGTHSKNSSSSTVPGNELDARVLPQVSVIPEDDDGSSTSIATPQLRAVRAADVQSITSSRPPSGVEMDQHMALSPPNGSTPPFMVRPSQAPRSASPASQLARSPETIRIGPARFTDSIYGRSPASISNLRSPRLLPSSASIASDSPKSPSPRVSSARGPNDFHFGETLGEGSYSTVLEAWDLLSGPTPKEPGIVDPNATSAAAAMVGSESSRKRRRKVDLTGRKAYAIKVLDKVHILKQGKQKYVSIEKEALSRMIRHPGVVTLFWTFQDRESLYFVLELASNGELLNFIRKHGSFDLTSARYYAAQLADTIDAMHRAGVVHRDVKPENILLDARHRIKITDFGSAKIVHAAGEADSQTTTATAQQNETQPATSSQNQPRAASFVGTAEYVSPELLVEKAQPAGKPADWWAFGCVLFQMIAGRPPFKGVNEYQTLQKVKNREFTFPEGFPEDAQDLIDRVLTLDPAKRPSAAEIKGHRFFSDIDFGTLWEADAPEIKTGLVQPLPPAQQRELGETSDFSFDEGFGSSEESQAYNGDTQSIDYQSRGGPDESSLSLDAASSGQPNDADDSELSDASSDNHREGRDGASSLPRRQSGLQRLADGFQSRFMSNNTGGPLSGNGGSPAFAQQSGGGAAPRRKFSTMSIDGANPASSQATSENGSEGAGQVPSRTMRPFSRSMQTMGSNPSPSHSPSPSVVVRNQASLSVLGANSNSSTGSGLQQSWAALLLPKELMLYSLPVAQKKTGTGKMFTKRRQLVLTDFPRLLCVKETAAALKVKSEVILAIPASKACDTGASSTGNASANGETAPKAAEFEKVSGRQAPAVSDEEAEQDDDSTAAANLRSASQQQQAIPNLLTALEYRGGKAFTIRIANGRNFLYETISGDASGLVKCIQEARRSASTLLKQGL
ncbi:hypothetical protein NDA16_002489 [Ustilago loliicola]|nr:hypothetical protein NDA16_002489 [Ustilago loliicola]